MTKPKSKAAAKPKEAAKETQVRGTKMYRLDEHITVELCDTGDVRVLQDGSPIAWVDTYAMRYPDEVSPVQQGNLLVHVWPTDTEDEPAITLVVTPDLVAVRSTNEDFLVYESDTSCTDDEVEQYTSDMLDKTQLPLTISQARNKYPLDRLRIRLLQAVLEGKLV